MSLISLGLATNYGSEPKIQNQMRGAAGALKLATQEMASYADQIAAKGFTEQIKVSLLNTARSILQNTVEMLQLADSFDVQQITRAGRYVEDEVISNFVFFIPFVVPLDSNGIFGSLSSSRTRNIKAICRSTLAHLITAPLIWQICPPSVSRCSLVRCLDFSKSIPLSTSDPMFLLVMQLC